MLTIPGLLRIRIGIYVLTQITLKVSGVPSKSWNFMPLAPQAFISGIPGKINVCQEVMDGQNELVFGFYESCYDFI